jgi:hypothetical protein
MDKESAKTNNHGFDVTTVAIISAVALTIGLTGTLLLNFFDPKPPHRLNCGQVNKAELKYD